jgi:hypothetical protein
MGMDAERQEIAKEGSSMKDADLSASIGKRGYLLTRNSETGQYYAMCVYCRQSYPINKEGVFKDAQVETTCHNCNFEINGII